MTGTSGPTPCLRNENRNSSRLDSRGSERQQIVEADESGWTLSTRRRQHLREGRIVCRTEEVDERIRPNRSALVG